MVKLGNLYYLSCNFQKCSLKCEKIQKFLKLEVPIFSDRKLPKNL